MKFPAAALLNAGIVIRTKSHRRQKKGTVTSYCEAVNYLFETYPIDEMVAEADVHMMHLTQPSDKSPTKYVDNCGMRHYNAIEPTTGTCCKSFLLKA